MRPAAQAVTGARALQEHIVVAGHDHRAATVQMRLQQGPGSGCGLSVQADQRFVQHPERRRAGAQACQGNALTLPL